MITKSKQRYKLSEKSKEVKYMSTADDPSSSYEGPSAAHRLSFSSKKEKRRTIIIQCSNQS